MFAQRLSALAEILLVLALGNILGELIFSVIAPPPVLDGTASKIAQAAYSGLLIFLRLGSAGLFGLILLYYRQGITPRQAGLSRNNHSLRYLIGQGLVLGLLSGFLVCSLFVLHSLIPLGEGLPAWWTYSDTPIDTAFWIGLLSTSVLIPPLTEEIMARGYFRTRLVESYGMMAGVIITSLVFGLSHTRYLNGDSMLLLFMGIILISSLMWTYLAQKTGSIIAPLVAHAFSNGVGIAVLFNIWIPFLMTGLGVLLFIQPIKSTVRQFIRDWYNDSVKHSLWQGLAIVLTILVIALVMLSQLGRLTTLSVLGISCLIVTLANLINERHRAKHIQM